MLRETSGIIATRFHSMILGWIYNINVFPFIYSPKTINVLKDINFDGYFSEISKVSELNISAVEHQLFKTNPLNVEKIVLDADEQFSKLDLLLDKY